MEAIRKRMMEMVSEREKFVAENEQLKTERDALRETLDYEKMCMASCVADNKKWHGKYLQAQDEVARLEGINARHEEAMKWLSDNAEIYVGKEELDKALEAGGE